jgi:hypothetical protein
MSLETLTPGLKPKPTGRGFGAHVLSGGILPPITSRATSDALGITKPDVPQIPGTPTIDDARVQRQESDRIRRRKGALANIFGGASASATPAVGTKVLLGT